MSGFPSTNNKTTTYRNIFDETCLELHDRSDVGTLILPDEPRVVAFLLLGSKKGLGSLVDYEIANA